MALFVVNLEVIADNPPCKDAPTVKDIDGYVYKTVQIGNQCWMRENMRTTHAADGSSIPMDKFSDTKACRYAPDDNTANVSSYGYLYNFPAARKVCPKGWHLPSKAEFEALMNYCKQHYAVGGNSGYIGKSLAAKTGWSSDKGSYTIGNNPSANNTSGFSALPAGGYYSSAFLFGEHAYFWSAISDLLGLDYDSKDAEMSGSNPEYGWSVRCIKD